LWFLADDVRGDWLPLLGGVAYRSPRTPQLPTNDTPSGLSTENGAPLQTYEAAGGSKLICVLLTAYKLDRYLLRDNTLFKTFFQ
jgi:hypothetical protein